MKLTGRVQNFLTAFLLLGSLLIPSILYAKPPAAFSPNRPTVIYTDLLVDDIEALLVMGYFFRENHGKNLLFVTVDERTERKAHALHNLLQVLGLTEARVVAGDPNNQVLDFDYVRDYRQDEHAKFLDALLELHDLKIWRARDYRKEVATLAARSNKLDVLLLANPLSFMESVATLDPHKIQQILTMGIHKLWSDGSYISSYNSNSNLRATIGLLDWVEAQQVPLYLIPSNLVTSVPEVATAIRDPRMELYSNPAQQGALARLRRGLQGFRNNLTNILGRRYGLLAPHIRLWDPESEAWLQDLITTAVALRPEFADWQGQELRFDLSETGRQQLGQKITVHDKAWSTVQVAKSLHVGPLAESLAQAYAGVTVLPDFDPKRSIELGDGTPIAMITKSAIDDIGALRMLLGLGRRLQLVIAESTQTPTVAEILRRILAGFHRSDIEVVTGKGQTAEELAKIPAMKLEMELIEKKLLGRAFLSDAEHAALNAIDASTLSAEAQLTKFLEKNAKVDLFIGASLEEVHAVFTKRPDLLAKLRRVKIMGGWRPKDQTKPDVGPATRNSILAPDKTREVFEIFERAGIEVDVYSSHLAGGVLDREHMPQFLQTLSELGDIPVERQMNEGRKDWNRGLNELKGGGIDIEGNYGPPLAWLMATRLGLGKSAENFYGSRRGRLKMSGINFEFVDDPTGNVHLVDQPENFAILDSTAAYLSRLAHQAVLKTDDCSRPLQD
jgi:inosine-uridine nucleoside N-ribohydrolase